MTFVLREARLQDEKKRQNSIELEKTLANEILQDKWKEMQLKVIAAAKEAYEWAIKNNLAKEQARAVLPEGNTGSRLYMNGTLRSWIHFIELRSGPETQKEHREVAKACAQVIAEAFPMSQEFITEK